MNRSQSSHQQLHKLTVYGVQIYEAVIKQMAVYFYHILYQETKKKSKHFGLVFTEYLPWINVAGPALPSTTFALSLRLPFTN